MASWHYIRLCASGVGAIYVQCPHRRCARWHCGEGGLWGPDGPLPALRHHTLARGRHRPISHLVERHDIQLCIKESSAAQRESAQRLRQAARAMCRCCRQRSVTQRQRRSRPITALKPRAFRRSHMRNVCVLLFLPRAPTCTTQKTWSRSRPSSQAPWPTGWRLSRGEAVA